MIYQELWGAEYIQGERLDPGVVDSQLPVDPWTFNAREDAQVGGQPRGVWERNENVKIGAGDRKSPGTVLSENFQF